MKLSNIFNHFLLITQHKWVVFKLCSKVGLHWRGLIHDMSKYSPSEFVEGVKYYTGSSSPITGAKRDKGFSEAWIHHKGRNKHHPEYWVDETAPSATPIIPYKYAAEMVCDKMAAGIVYQGKNWTKEYQLSYWEKEKLETRIHPQVAAFMTAVLTQVAEEGIDKTYTKANIKKLYQLHCGHEYEEKGYELNKNQI